MEWNQEVGKAALERMKLRASCRAFTDDPIPESTLQEILEVGIRAASGGNLQPYSIIVVKDQEKNKELAELCGGQRFMGEAPVNLIFLLDWYKISRWATLQKAPFTANRSYMHYLIGVEDLMCAAQSIETAAWQMGIGSVYIGTVNAVGRDLAKLYNLPKYTYPVLILTLGYPKHEMNQRERLPYEMTVFEERYPDFTDLEIQQGFEAKYGTKERALPKGNEEQVAQGMELLKSAFATTFAPDEVEALIQEAVEKGTIRYLQYVFGLHYSAGKMREHGIEIMEMMQEMELEPFNKK
jgi:FMN reductase [NAD(P)H]